MHCLLVRRIVSVLVATVSALTVAGCFANRPDATEEFKLGPFYEYTATELSVQEDGYEVGWRDAAFGSDYCAVLGIGYNDAIREAEDLWYDSMGTSDFKVLPTDEEGNVCVTLKELFFFDSDGGFITKVDLDKVQGYSREIPCIQTDGEDHVHAIVCNGDIETGRLYYYDLEFDSKGELISNTNLGFDRHVDVYDCCYASNGNIYYYCTDNETYSGLIYSFSKAGEMQSVTEYQYPVKSFVSMNGNDYVFTCLYDSENDVSNACLIPVGSALDGNTDNIIMLPEQFIESQYIVVTDKGLFTGSETGIYCYNIETEEISMIMDSVSSQCPYDPYYFSAKPDGTLVYLGNDSLNNGLFLVHCIPTDKNPMEGREKLIIAGVDINEDPVILNMVKVFNMENTEYYFEIRDYGAGESEDLTSSYEGFMDDIRYSHITDEAPDIIVDPYNILPLSEISNSSFLIDLSPYVNSMDISLIPWYDGLYDDSQYTVFLSYYLNLLAVDDSSDLINDADAVTYTDYETLAQGEGYSGNSIIGTNKTDYLTSIVRMRIRDFYNIDTNEVRFDTEEFRSLLEWINDNVNDNEESLISLGNGAFAQQELIADANQMIFDRESIASSNVSYIGFPAEDKSLIAAYPQYCFAITADCKHPDVAWTLISMGYNDIYQNILSRTSFPVNSIIENGLRASRFEEIEDETMRARYTDKINSLIDSVNCVVVSNDDLSSILTEESGAYFYGDVSLDVAIDRIQNRATLVMSEEYT